MRSLLGSVIISSLTAFIIIILPQALLMTVFYEALGSSDVGQNYFVALLTFMAYCQEFWYAPVLSVIVVTSIIMIGTYVSARFSHE